jgi:hypothetical protein
MYHLDSQAKGFSKSIPINTFRFFTILLETKHMKKFRLKITIIMTSIHGQKNFKNKKITQI